MKKRLFIQYLLLSMIIIMPACNFVRAQAPFFSRKQAIEALSFSSDKYRQLMSEIPVNRLPNSVNKEGELTTTGSGSWVSGFYPGTLWYLYKFTSDEAFKTEAISRTALIEKEKWNKGTHDLGFMIFCSFGNGYKFTGEKNYKDIIITASNSLISRYNKNTGLIRSWDHNKDKWQYPVIIDNMMNLEMLFWASQVTNDPTYSDIALTHARNTMKNHFRDDYSSWHVINYDTITGEVISRDTHQGYSDESAWSRGQAWGLYGYTMCYRMTGDNAFLDQAKSIADFILTHENLPDDMVPYWDFNAPNIPNEKRDASSASIMASALIELSSFVNNPESTKYFNAAEKMLASLSSPKYLANSEQNGIFLIKHNVGSIPHNGQVDVPLNYADYYYVEALNKYIHLK